MRRWKYWLCTRFLPLYCRGELIDENRRLREALAQKEEENARLRMYIRGMAAGVRARPKIVIKGGTADVGVGGLEKQ